MPDLSHLTIGKVPSAFAEFAEKHNELVALIGSIEAATGINIKMVSSPAKKLKVPGTSTIFSKKPRGRIRIGIQSAQPTGLSAQTASSPIIQKNGTTVGQQPTLNFLGNSVRITNNSNANAVEINVVPYELHCNNNVTFIDIDTAGFKYNSNGVTVSIDDSSLRVLNGTTSKQFIIQPGNITQNISIQTFVGCNSGNSANYLVMASNFF